MSIDAKNQKGLKIVQGEDRLIKLLLKKVNCGEVSALKLTGASEISVIFKNADKSELIKLLTASDVSIVDEYEGKIQVSLTDTETKALRVGENLDFKVKIDFGTETRIIQFMNCLTIQRCD